MHQNYKNSTVVSPEDNFVFYTDKNDGIVKHMILNWNKNKSQMSIDIFDDYVGIPPSLFVGLVASKSIAPDRFGDVALKGAVLLLDEKTVLPSRFIGKPLTINTVNPGARFPFNLTIWNDHDNILIGTCINSREIIIGL
jgi:hypothetical protein